MLRAGKLGVPTLAVIDAALTLAGAAEQVTEPAPLPPPAVPLCVTREFAGATTRTLRCACRVLCCADGAYSATAFGNCSCAARLARRREVCARSLGAIRVHRRGNQGAIAAGKVRVVLPLLTVAPPVPSALDRAAFGLPMTRLSCWSRSTSRPRLSARNLLAIAEAFPALRFWARLARIPLVLKIGNPDHRTILAQRPPPLPPRQIFALTRILPHADSHALTAAADIILSLHRARRSTGFRRGDVARQTGNRHRLVRQYGIYGCGSAARVGYALAADMIHAKV